MKTRKLDGFGSLGVEVYDFDLKTCSDEDIRELGRIVIDQLVVLVRKECCSVSPERLNHVAKVFGDPFGGVDQSAYNIVEHRKRNNTLTREDLRVLKELRKIRSGLEQYDGMIRVTGKKDEEGDYIGMFADGELDWHSDRQGTGNFVPMIMLMAQEGTAGTSTEFMHTCDAFGSLPKDMQERLEKLIGVHRYQPHKIAPGLNASQDNIVRMNMCPIDDSEVPLVCYSPGGRKGIRLSYNTITHFKDCSKEESKWILEYIIEQFMKPEYVYHHDWEDGDLVFMDQTITVHRRPTKDCSKRVMIRQTCNFDNLLSKGTQGLQNVGHSEPGIIVNGRKITSEEYLNQVKFQPVY